VLYLRLIILLVVDDVLIDNETLLVTDFVNLKIKPAQSFRYAHRVRCACVYRIECSYVYEYLHLYCVSQQKLVFNERKKARLLIYVTASMYLYSPCMINLSPPFEQWIGHMISFLN
jgi:hypothetical protein